MKVRKDAISLLLFSFPLTVAVLMIIEGVLWKLVTGHSLFGVDPALGAMAMVISMLTIPVAIVRGDCKWE